MVKKGFIIQNGNGKNEMQVNRDGTFSLLVNPRTVQTLGGVYLKLYHTTNWAGGTFLLSY